MLLRLIKVRARALQSAARGAHARGRSPTPGANPTWHVHALRIEDAVAATAVLRLLPRPQRPRRHVLARHLVSPCLCQAAPQRGQPGCAGCRRSRAVTLSAGRCSGGGGGGRSRGSRVRLCAPGLLLQPPVQPAHLQKPRGEPAGGAAAAGWPLLLACPRGATSCSPRGLACAGLPRRAAAAAPGPAAPVAALLL